MKNFVPKTIDEDQLNILKSNLETMLAMVVSRVVQDGRYKAYTEKEEYNHCVLFMLNALGIITSKQELELVQLGRDVIEDYVSTKKETSSLEIREKLDAIFDSTFYA